MVDHAVSSPLPQVVQDELLDIQASLDTLSLLLRSSASSPSPIGIAALLAWMSERRALGRVRRRHARSMHGGT